MGRIIRLTERDLTRIVRRFINENEEEEEENYDLEMKKKLDDIFFGQDSQNIFTPSGEFGYLSQENKLDGEGEITPQQRKNRIEKVIEELEDYIDYMKTEHLGSEDSFINMF